MNLPASSSRAHLDVSIFWGKTMRINNWIGGGVGDEVGTAQQFETFSFQWTLNLQEGDEIWLKISLVSTDTYYGVSMGIKPTLVALYWRRKSHSLKGNEFC